MHSMLNGLHEENKKYMCNNFRPLFAKALKNNVTRLGCDEKYSWWQKFPLLQKMLLLED